MAEAGVPRCGEGDGEMEEEKEEEEAEKEFLPEYPTLEDYSKVGETYNYMITGSDPLL